MALPRANFSGDGASDSAAGAGSRTANTNWLPSATWAGKAEKPFAPARTMAAAAMKPDVRQLQVAADSAPIRLTYGRDRLGAMVANVLTLGNYLVLQVVWGEGPITSLESITLDDKPPAAGVKITHYLGLASQGVDPTLKQAWQARGEAFADTFPGVAYSVISLPAPVESMPAVAAVIRGVAVRDDRTGLIGWSENPALVLADFMRRAGRRVDASSVPAAANACDELVAGEARRKIGLTLSEPRAVDAWIDVLRTYACCWVIPGRYGYRLVPDRPAATVRTIRHADGDILGISPLSLRPVHDVPTVLRVRYTNTSALPWADDVVTAYAAGVLTGTTPWRESEVPMEGVHRAGQAMREAVERLNKLTLSDLSFTLALADEALQLDAGDVVTVSIPEGPTDKPMRVMRVEQTEAGRHQVLLAEYDQAVYSDVIVSEPSNPDTSLPDPATVPAVQDLVLAEELFQLQDGTWSSRIRATWSPAEYPWSAGHRINVLQGGALVDTGTSRATQASWPSRAMEEGITYTVEVLLESRYGTSGPPAVASIRIQGKQLPPGNVPALQAFEVGGQVRLSWQPAIDIDIWRCEVRYGAVGVAWEHAKLIDRVDALRLVTQEIPEGTWDFLVKAIDSVGHESPVAARRAVTVTLDAGAFLVDTAVFDVPTVTGMHEFNLGRLDGGRRRWVSENGVAAATKFPGALSAYPQPMAAYSTNAAQWLSEVEDFGLLLAGNWRAEAVVQNLAGTRSEALELSTNNSAWESHPMTAKANARFARLRIRTTAGSAMYVELPGAQVRIDAIPREESGQSTSVASGPRTITTAGNYAAVKRIGIAPLGTTPLMWVLDNIVVGPTTRFDVHIFNNAGARVAAPFRWDFEGV